MRPAKAAQSMPQAASGWRFAAGCLAGLGAGSPPVALPSKPAPTNACEAAGAPFAADQLNDACGADRQTLQQRFRAP